MVSHFQKSHALGTDKPSTYRVLMIRAQPQRVVSSVALCD
jgi:hypothetical protein